MKLSPRNYAHARGAEHEAAHDLPGEAAQSESGTAASEHRGGTPWLISPYSRSACNAGAGGGQSFPAQGHQRRRADRRRHQRRFRSSGTWRLALTGGITLLLFAMLGYLVFTGIGVWGNNQPVGWAWDITNFVFWIGIGHAGTLISAILFLFRQKWRTSINRSAEAMTIFAVACALIYPLFHTGRPWRAAYWLLPLPKRSWRCGRTSAAR